MGNTRRFGDGGAETGPRPRTHIGLLLPDVPARCSHSERPGPSHLRRPVALYYFALLGLAILPILLRKLFQPRQIPAIFHQEFPKALLLRPGQLRAAAEESALMIPAAAGLSAVYPTIACPVAIIAGKDDAIVEPQQATRLHAVLPLSTVASVPGVGHMLHHFAPADVVRAVQAVAALDGLTA